jgi:hypothetical protein
MNLGHRKVPIMRGLDGTANTKAYFNGNCRNLVHNPNREFPQCNLK